MLSIKLMQKVARLISAIRRAFKQCDALLQAGNISQ